MAARALLIANPLASRVDADALAAVRSVFTGAGWRLEVAETRSPGAARRLAERAVAERPDLVVCYGGDGTATQIAAALVGSDVPLALVPGGTGNLLAGNLRLPRDPLHAAEAAIRGRPRAIDLGRVERDDGEHFFAVAAGAGFDALLMAETPAAAKQRWGFGGYVLTVSRLIGHVRNAAHVVVVDGQAFEAPAAMVMIANCGEIAPPWFRLHERIAFDDGLLDVVIVSADSPWQGARALWQLWSGTGGSAGAVRFARGREVQVTAEPAQPVQLDGEPLGTTPVRAVVVPRALWVVGPPDRP